MTLIVGLKCANAVILAAEMEESVGYTAKRNIYKLTHLSGDDWHVIIGGAGDSAICENVIRRLLREFNGIKDLTERRLTDAIDEVLSHAYTKYIDPDPRSDGLALIIGASFGQELLLISTHKRIYQIEDDYAHAGYGADLASYWLERLHVDQGASWEEHLNLAAFVLMEVKESSQFCGGGSHAFVLQAPPNPRWRFIGEGSMMGLENFLRGPEFTGPIFQKLMNTRLDFKKNARDRNDYDEEEQK
jgi:20S proteasome alpha/beta subunit